MKTQFRTQQTDAELFKIMEERYRENSQGFTLIASENHPHPEDEAAYRDANDATFAGGYFEGYPAREGARAGSGRYYQGVLQADALEKLAQKRIRSVIAPGQEKIVGVNVQAPTGAIANMVAYGGVLNFGDTMVAPSLSDGYGHLSHGADSPNIVKNWFNAIGYAIDKATGLIDYDQIEEVVEKNRPKLVLSGFSSYPREIDWKRIAAIANKVGAVSMADISHPGGIIGAGLMNNPFTDGIDIITSTTHKTWGGLKGAIIAYNKESLANKLPEKVIKKGARQGEYNGIDFSAFPGMLGGPNMSTIASYASTFKRAKTQKFRELQQRTLDNAKTLAEELSKKGWPIMTDGTDNHIVLIKDVTRIYDINKEIIKDGWEAAMTLENEVGLATNKNAIPGVPGNPIRPMGLRFGTPAVSTRGLKTTHVQELAEIIDSCLRYSKERDKLEKLKRRVCELAEEFPVPTYL